ncbi:MAG: hypothetical protein H6R18_2070 [Proteobacteria bacterium]|nr:hypothetical protein [Pseudomonadota bacterium]
MSKSSVNTFGLSIFLVLASLCVNGSAIAESVQLKYLKQLVKSANPNRPWSPNEELAQWISLCSKKPQEFKESKGICRKHKNLPGAACDYINQLSKECSL